MLREQPLALDSKPSSSYMTSQACATCALVFSSALDQAPDDEHHLLRGRDLICCGRSICIRCLASNKRFEIYCPYCQISTQPSLLPQGLRDPPSYSTLTCSGPPLEGEVSEQPPAYSLHRKYCDFPETLKDNKTAPDVLHFVSPKDNMQQLALAYGVPLPVLRKVNNIYSDHLLQGRRTVLIPGEYNKGGICLSPGPPEGEEEEMKKTKTRRFMVACKVSDYDIALLYLQRNEWDLSTAISAYEEDEQWELDHPIEGRFKTNAGKMSKGAGMRRFVGVSSQASCTT